MGIFHGYVSLAGGNTLNPKMEVDGYVMTFLTQIEVIFRLQPLGFREKTGFQCNVSLPVGIRMEPNKPSKPA